MHPLTARLPSLTLVEIAALVREYPELFTDARAELEARGTNLEPPRLPVRQPALPGAA